MHLRSGLEIFLCSHQRDSAPALTTTSKRKRSEQPDEQTSYAPPKRARLTQKNLTAHCEILREPKSMARKKKSQLGKSQCESQSSSTTTSNRFGPQLSANHVVYQRWEAKPPNDFEDIRQCLDKDRASPSPEQEDWQDYLEGVGESKNEATLQLTTWYRVAKPAPGKGYLCDVNFEWTEVDGPVTDRIGNAKPDITESYRLRKYPQQAIDDLGPALAPTSHTMAMPLFAVEAKSIEKGTMNAEQQCAYDGAIIVDAVRKVYATLGKSPESFWEKTQALTLAYNGNDMIILANHAVENAGIVERHSYPLFSDTPLQSLEHFKATRRHTRNAQDWCRVRATRTLEDLRNYNGGAGVASDPITPPQSDSTAFRNAFRNDTHPTARLRMS